MTLNAKYYRNKPVRITVAEITQDNIEEAARWCGGSVEKVHNTLSNGMVATGLLAVPTIHGIIYAEIGSLVSRDTESGRFSVISRNDLENEFVQEGIRNQNPFPRLGGN